MLEQVNAVIKNWVNTPTFGGVNEDSQGWTPLHLAPKISSQLFIYLVEECGADVSKKNKFGFSVMHKAAFYDNSYILTYLRDKHGRSIQETDD